MKEGSGEQQNEVKLPPPPLCRSLKHSMKVGQNSQLKSEKFKSLQCDIVRSVLGLKSVAIWASKFLEFFWFLLQACVNGGEPANLCVAALPDLSIQPSLRHKHDMFLVQRCLEVFIVQRKHTTTKNTHTHNHTKKKTHKQNVHGIVPGFFLGGVVYVSSSHP